MQQVVVFGEIPRWLNLLGSALILLTAVMVALDKLLAATKTTKVGKASGVYDIDATPLIITEATLAHRLSHSAEHTPLLISDVTGRQRSTV